MMRRVRVYTTEAIVLKRQNLGEADRIVTLYTPDEGKLRAVAKGVRRPASRLAGHLELFSLSLVQLARGRELDVLTQAETRAAFRNVREDLARTSQAYYALELVDRFTPDRLEHGAVFHLLRELLETLDGPAPSPLALHHFTLHALAALGYRPQLAQCVLRAYTEALIERRLRTGEFLDRLRLDARLRAADAAPASNENAQPVEPEGAELAAPGASA